MYQIIKCLPGSQTEMSSVDVILQMAVYGVIYFNNTDFVFSL